MKEPALGDGPGNLNSGGPPNPRPGVGPSPLAGGQRRRVRRRVGRPPWVRIWLYFREGPPAELVESLVEMCRPAETFSNSRGPWHRGLVVARERRFRKKRSPAERYVRHGAPGDLARLVNGTVRRHPIALGLSAAALFWWFWPWLRPQTGFFLQARSPNAPRIVAVEATDFRRTITAMSIWRFESKGLLVLMVPSAQSLGVIQNEALSRSQRERIVNIGTCGDTITEIADLSRWLKTLRDGPGDLTLVTSPAHIERMTAIGRIMLGGAGWKVEGVGSQSSNNEPESIFRRWRDELRAQFWRATGLSGKELGLCRARGQGLL